MAQRSPPLNDRATSWLAALGTIMSALMSSSPTTRIATTTVVAVSTASTMLSGEHGDADGAGVLLVVGHREEARPQRPGRDGDEHGEPGEDVEVGALCREDRAEEVLHEVGRGAARATC